VDGGNAFVVLAKDLHRPGSMKSELPVQLEHYFLEANLGTVQHLNYWLVI
jgi:hypothetical protein